MKITKRTLLCLILVVLMVASCAITAMAVSNESTALIGGTKYEYTWSLSPKDTYGSANMATKGTPASFTVTARNYLYSKENDTFGYGAWESNTGYSSVSVTANNILVIENVNVPSHVESMDGNFYIGNELVLLQRKAA